MSDLVGNPEDRFSHNEARIMELCHSIYGFNPLNIILLFKGQGLFAIIVFNLSEIILHLSSVNAKERF